MQVRHRAGSKEAPVQRTIFVLSVSLAASLLAACQKPATDATPDADTPAATPDAPAATAAAAAEVNTYRYQCGDALVTAAFAQGDGPVTLTWNGDSLTLPHVPSGSGARYADDKGNELWTKGTRDGMLTLAGEAQRTCTAVSADAPAPSAPADDGDGAMAGASDAAAMGDTYPAARDACLAAVAKQTNRDASTLKVTEVLWAQAGVGVTIEVPGAQAPWSCLSDEKGNVQGAAYTRSEGGA